MSTGSDTKFSFYIKLYYEFGGSTEWLKEELIKKRFDSFRYLLPVLNKDKSNIMLELYSIGNNTEDKYMNIISNLRFANIINITKVLIKDYKLSVDECNKLYNFLKETYYENK